MRSLQTTGDAEAVLRNVANPSATENEVLVRPLATGICGTDIDIIDGQIDRSFVTYPVTIGHEWCGVVVGHGDGVTEPAVGTRVSIEGIIPCGGCAECLKGTTNRCHTYSEIGFTRPGATADLVAVPVKQLHILSPKVTIETACLIEPSAVVFQGLQKVSPAAGARVLVVGDGTIGLLAAKWIRQWDPAIVDLVGLRESQAGLAHLAGVDSFATAPSAPEASYDLIIEASGSPSAISLSLKLLARGGTLLLLGFPGREVTVPLNVDDLINGDNNIVGSFGYTHNTWVKTVELLNSGDIDLSFVVTHRFPLEQWRDGLEAMRNDVGMRAKVLLKIS